MTAKRNSYAAEEICNALMDLMKEKKYSDITVSDLTKKAQVARASFYRNFSSIDEVMDRVTASLTHVFVDQVIPILETGDEASLEILLTRAIMNMEQTNQVLSSLDPANVSMLVSRMSTHIQTLQEAKNYSSIEETYLLAAKFAIIINVLNLWYCRKQKETQNEIIQCILSYLRKL